MKKKSKSTVVAYHEPKRVTVEKADNGFVISHYGNEGSKSSIAKNHAEMLKHVKKHLK